MIVAAEVTQEVLDRGQLSAMMESTERNAGQRPEVVTADAGYWNTEMVQKATHNGENDSDENTPDGLIFYQGFLNLRDWFEQWLNFSKLRVANGRGLARKFQGFEQLPEAGCRIPKASSPRSTSYPSSGASCRPHGLVAARLPNQHEFAPQSIPVPLRQTGHDMKEETPRRRFRVDAVGQALKVDLLIL